MDLVDIDGNEYNGKLITVECINEVFYLKNNGDGIIKINNVVMIGEYAVLFSHDKIEIVHDEYTKILFAVEGKEFFENCKSDKFCNPFIVPQYQTFPESTAILGILYAHNNYEEWVYNNFGLIWAYIWIWDSSYWCDFKFGHNLIQYEMCPMIERKKVDKNNLQEKGEVIKFFKKELNGKYIYVSMDMISVDEWWGKEEQRYHCNHPVLVYGYNNDDEVFYCADFLRGKYKKFSLTHSQFFDGYFGGDNHLYIWTYHDIRIEREHNFVTAQIKDFIKGKDTTKNDFLNLNVYYNVLYGFEALERICLNVKVKSELGKTIDLRSVHLIKVHNQIMRERLLYWKTHNMGEEDAIVRGEQIIDEIISNITLLEMLCIKVIIKPNIRYNMTISRKFDETINQMKLLYEILLDIVDNTIKDVQQDELWNNWDKLKKDDDINSDVEGVEYHNSNLQRLVNLWDEVLEKQYDKQSILKHVKGCSAQRIVTDFYENVFPLEIQEDGFLCRGQVVEIETGSIDEKKYYYDNNNRIIAIEYLDKMYKKCWLLFTYNSNEVVRLKFREHSDKVVLDNIKLEVDENKRKTLYSYSKNKHDRKVDIYYLNNKQVISSERYCCHDESVSIYKWMKKRWSERREYIYAKNGELLQIFMYDYENARKMIYSNLNRQLGEEEIMKDFYNILCNQLNVCEKVLKIEFDTKVHKIVLIKNYDVNNNIVYKFLEEYDLDSYDLQRLGVLFGIEIYKVLECYVPKCSIQYFIDGREIKIEDGSFIKQNNRC